VYTAMKLVSWSWSSFYLASSVFIVLPVTRGGNPDAKRLYDDLLSNYNKLVRPVSNISEAVTVHLKLKLSQLIAVNLKSQIMTTNLWVEQFWQDYKLKWNPEEYGGVTMLHVPSDHIWRPDIVLYNNADGNFEVTLATKATLHASGLVEWKPPAIYHSSCEMDVEYFPFDEQTCVMKFGSWTYDGFQVDLRHKQENHTSEGIALPGVHNGIDLTEFYMSVEWDILEVPAIRNVKFYTCCDEPYLDITFNITMRRKTLFYTVNLIIPCMGISFLTILVFYLPSDSGEKVSLSISILLSLTVFFLLLAEIIPPTSLVVPLLGKFVLFTMILDTFSICVTVVVLNVHFRTPQTHTMAPWVRRVFIHILPRLLAMRRPHYEMDKHRGEESKGNRILVRTCNGLEVHDPPYQPGCSSHGRHYGAHSTHQIERGRQAYSPDITARYSSREEASHSLHGQQSRHKSPRVQLSREGYPVNGGAGGHGYPPNVHRDPYPVNGGCKVHGHSSMENLFPQLAHLKEDKDELKARQLCPEIYKALEGILFIAEHKKRSEESTKIIEDWKYVAMVMDRLFLWIFTVAVLVGTAGIILQAPTLYDDRDPIDFQLSQIWGHQHSMMTGVQ